MSRLDFIPNPLADRVRDELDPLLCEIDDRCGRLVLDVNSNCGLEYDEDSPGDFRASTNSEVRHGTFSFEMKLHVEFTDDLVEQLVGWFDEAAALLQTARVNLCSLQDTRDREGLRQLLEESAD